MGVKQKNFLFDVKKEIILFPNPYNEDMHPIRDIYSQVINKSLEKNRIIFYSVNDIHTKKKEIVEELWKYVKILNLFSCNLISWNIHFDDSTRNLGTRIAGWLRDEGVAVFVDDKGALKFFCFI